MEESAVDRSRNLLAAWGTAPLESVREAITHTQRPFLAATGLGESPPKRVLLREFFLLADCKLFEYNQGVCGSERRTTRYCVLSVQRLLRCGRANGKRAYPGRR
jgi:hypothetical protein